MMKNKLMSIMLIAMLLVALTVSTAYASGTVTLDNISDKSAGDAVTISGTTTLQEITIKVIAPNKTVLYFNTAASGNFSDTFTLPIDAANGAYEVVAGMGSTVATTIFNVPIRHGGGSTGGSSGGSSGGGSGAAADSGTSAPIAVSSEGKAVITAVTEVNADTKTASATINAATITNAFSQAKANADGIKVITIEIPKTGDTKAFEAKLPASALAESVTGKADKMVEIKTEVATLVVPVNMINPSLAANAANVSLSVASADKASLSEEAKDAIGNRPVVELSLKIDGNAANWSNPAAPVKVTIPYTPSAEELKNPENIVVWYIDGNKTPVPVYSSKFIAPDKVEFTTTHFSTYAVALVFKTFDDIASYDWAKKQIEALAVRGIIQGTSDKTFDPDANITRSDYLVLLVRTLNLNASFEDNFKDVSTADYYYNSIGIAKKLGITDGVGGNMFNPNAEISRQDMMTLTAKALKAQNKLNSTGTASDISKFNDAGQVASYAVDSIAALVNEKLIQGNGNTLNPVGNATRAETAVLMYRIFNKQIKQ